MGGTNNGDGGSVASGYREVTWDDVPDHLAAPAFTFPRDFYRSRGLVLTSSARDEFYQVSADSTPLPVGTPPRFGNIDGSYPSIFQTFSGERLFTAFAATMVEVTFVVPGTMRPATVRSFGIVLADVDHRPNDLITNTIMRAYSISGRLLGLVGAADHNNGLTFHASTSVCPTEGIAKVQIFPGNSPLAPGAVDVGDGPAIDVVAIDNIMFSEPRLIGGAPGDFDGDGVTDIAIYRPSSGGWHVIQSGANTAVTHYWGEPGDIPVPADYDGDGRVDVTVFRPRTGEWWINSSFSGSQVTIPFGREGDIPVPADYDRDGKADTAVWRPSDGGFYINTSRLPFPVGGIAIYWGMAGDIPLTRKE